jgi:hypothetical protein
MRYLLLSLDPAEGAPGQPDKTSIATAHAPGAPQAASEGSPRSKDQGPKPLAPELGTDDRSPAPPPAAKVVLEGTKTEREVAMEKKIKEHEQRMAELQEENHTLKQPGPSQAAKQKRSFLDGATFFED